MKTTNFIIRKLLHIYGMEGAYSMINKNSIVLDKLGYLRTIYIGNGIEMKPNIEFTLEENADLPFNFLNTLVNTLTCHLPKDYTFCKYQTRQLPNNIERRIYLKSQGNVDDVNPKALKTTLRKRWRNYSNDYGYDDPIKLTFI